MGCPLCDEPSAVMEDDRVALRITCEPCGSTFRMAHEVVEEWGNLPASTNVLVLPLARAHLKIMGAFMGEPRIQGEPGGTR